MSIFRLLPLSLLIAVGVASVAAQSSPEKNSVAVPSTSSGPLNSSRSSDLLSRSLKPELSPQNPLDRIRVEEYTPRLKRPALLNRFDLGPDGLSQDPALCYAMRSYEVARDDPQSDSTHPVGYSTCQPATRFHVRTTDERVLSLTR